MYLAAHYAGQTWGMVASFAYLGGVLIQKIERQVLRSVLLVFVAWHVAIANHLVPKYTLFVPELKPFLDTLFEVITPFAHVAMVVAIESSFAWVTEPNECHRSRRWCRSHYSTLGIWSLPAAMRVCCSCRSAMRCNT